MDISEYCQEIINGPMGFNVWEDREFILHSNRDAAIAEWTIRCLANSENIKSQNVLNQIIEQRERN